MSNTIATVAETFGSDVIAFRSAAVSATNKSTSFARSMLAGLVAGVTTAEAQQAMIIHHFGNPKLANGKVTEKLSSKFDGMPGWGIVRDAYSKAVRIFTNIDADKATAGAIRPMVVAFILGTGDKKASPQNLSALVMAVNEAIRAHVAASEPEASDDAKADAADASEGEAKVDAKPDLGAMIAALMVALDAADVDALLPHDAALSGLMDNIERNWNRAVDATAPEALAA